MGTGIRKMHENKVNVQYTVDSDILFSLITLKDIFAMLKIRCSITEKQAMLLFFATSILGEPPALGCMDQKNA